MAAKPAAAVGLFVAVAERVRRAVAGVAATDPHPSDPFRGLYVSDEAALALASRPADDGVEERIASVGALLGLDGLDLPVLALCARRNWTPGSAGCWRTFTMTSRDGSRARGSPRGC